MTTILRTLQGRTPFFPVAGITFWEVLLPNIKGSLGDKLEIVIEWFSKPGWAGKPGWLGRAGGQTGLGRHAARPGRTRAFRQTGRPGLADAGRGRGHGQMGRRAGKWARRPTADPSGESHRWRRGRQRGWSEKLADMTASKLEVAAEDGGAPAGRNFSRKAARPAAENGGGDGYLGCCCRRCRCQSTPLGQGSRLGAAARPTAARRLQTDGEQHAVAGTMRGKKGGKRRRRRRKREEKEKKREEREREKKEREGEGKRKRKKRKRKKKKDRREKLGDTNLARHAALNYTKTTEPNAQHTRGLTIGASGKNKNSSADTPNAQAYSNIQRFTNTRPIKLDRHHATRIEPNTKHRANGPGFTTYPP